MPLARYNIFKIGHWWIVLRVKRHKSVLHSCGFCLRILSASPFINLFPSRSLTGSVVCVLELFSRYKCVRMSKIESLWNVLTLETAVSKIFISLSLISAMNFMVGWCLFASKIKWSIPLFLYPTGRSHRCTCSHLRGLIIDYCCFYSRHKDVGKRDSNFGPHRSAVSLDSFLLCTGRVFLKCKF